MASIRPPPASEDSEVTGVMPTETIRRLIASEPPPDRETTRCPGCWGLPCEPPCEVCDGRALVDPATATRYRTLAIDAAVAQEKT